MMTQQGNECACCFTGHRYIPLNQRDQLAARLRTEISALMEQGVYRFYAGGALGFDTMAAHAVLELRRTHPSIQLILALPCKTQTRGWSPRDVSIYEKIKREADEVVYLSEDYTSSCMQERNRYMVDHSRFCLCFLNHYAGGTAYTVGYARRKSLTVKNLSEL